MHPQHTCSHDGELEIIAQWQLQITARTGLTTPPNNENTNQMRDLDLETQTCDELAYMDATWAQQQQKINNANKKHMQHN